MVVRSPALDELVYVIWSNEHSAWWGPNRHGYTTVLSGAGYYSRAAAISIARDARGGWRKGENPPEIAIPLPDAIDQERGLG